MSDAPHIFSLFGYLSVLLWLAVPLLWLLHAVKRPRRWLCHYAVMVGLVALAFAKINSVTHVNRIQIDRSEQLAEAQARMEEARKAAKEARAEEAAQIRFAEDDADDHLDVGGMDEADRKYIESFDASVTPEWKKAKKERSSTRQRDDSLEGLLNTGDTGTGMDVETLEGDAPQAPLLMPEADVMLANRLDAINLKLIRWLLLAAVVVVLWDYLRRLNVYEEAYCPLPVSSALVNGLTPMPARWSRPQPPRRKMQEELAWLIRRGDAFVYLTDDPAAATAVPEQLSRLPRALWPVDVLRVSADDTLVDDAFVFEALWYNRASFVVDSAARAERLVAHLVKLLRGRRETRATARQTVHVVWDMSSPMPEGVREELVALARTTGWSVLEGTGRQ